MNTKLYTKVHALATGLLKAAESDNRPFFDRQYEELKTLCETNETGNKNHPVQWETLADFTEEIDEAILLYRKALACAEAINAHEYIASINYSMAKMLKEIGELEKALLAAQSADEHMVKNEDEELRQDIKTLILTLQ